MVNEKENSNNNVITFVSGDFNCNPTSDFPYSEGYKTMVDHGAYLDTYLETNEQANSLPSDPRYHTVGGAFPGRIDYIFLKKNDRVKIKASQIIFNDKIVGMVSDHYGVLTKFEVN